jgi:hypothetical protein
MNTNLLKKQHPQPLSVNRRRGVFKILVALCIAVSVHLMAQESGTENGVKTGTESSGAKKKVPECGCGQYQVLADRQYRKMQRAQLKTGKQGLFKFLNRPLVNPGRRHLKRRKKGSLPDGCFNWFG